MPKSALSKSILWSAIFLVWSLGGTPASAEAMLLNQNSVETLPLSCGHICRSDPHVIHVRPPSNGDRAALERDQRWLARCKPVIREDKYGMPRYVYAAEGCEYGRIN